MNATELDVIQLERTEAFGNHRYEVRHNGKLLVEIEHLYRGDEYWMRKPYGQWETTDRSLDRGGPEPLRLSESGLRDLNKLIGK